MKTSILGFFGVLVFWPLMTFAKVPNLQTVNDHILRGGRPSADDLTWLKAQQNVGLDIDLENVDEIISSESAETDQINMAFKSFPMSPWVRPNDAAVNEILDLLRATNSANTRVFVHCQHGQDRTGLIIGLYRVLVEHMSPEQAYDEMLAIGFHPLFVELDQYFKEKTGWSDASPK